MTMKMETTTATSEPTPDRLALATRGLEPESATALRAAFGPMLVQAEEWERRARALVVTDEADKGGMKLARESRLGLRQIRVAAENARKTMKEESLRRGKAIDAAYKVVEGMTAPLEAHLLEQETFAERAEQRRSEERAASRAETLRALGVDPTVFANLGAMPAEVWESTRLDAERAKSAREEAARAAEAARIEAERQASTRREEERQAAAKREAERAERERQAAEENARLRREREEADAAAKAERDRIEAEGRAAREKAEAAKRKAEAEAKRAREEAQQLRERAEREAREREEAEEQRRATEAAERERLAGASDREKLAALGAALAAVELPVCKSAKGRDAVARVEKMVAWVQERGAKL